MSYELTLKVQDWKDNTNDEYFQFIWKKRDELRDMIVEEIYSRVPEAKDSGLSYVIIHDGRDIFLDGIDLDWELPKEKLSHLSSLKSKVGDNLDFLDSFSGVEHIYVGSGNCITL